MNQMLFAELSKADQLTLQGEEIARGGFPRGRDVPSTSGFPRPIKHCSPVPKAVLLEDVCAKQEHLIAVTKLGHFSQTQAVFTKLKYFLESAVVTKVWSLALRSRLGCAKWAWDRGKSHQAFPQKHHDPRGTGQSEQAQPQQGLSCWGRGRGPGGGAFK